MQRPNLKELKPDLNSIKLLPKFIKKLMEGGDNNLLTLVINELEKNGFKIDYEKVSDKFSKYNSAYKVNDINFDPVIVRFVLSL